LCGGRGPGGIQGPEADVSFEQKNNFKYTLRPSRVSLKQSLCGGRGPGGIQGTEADVSFEQKNNFKYTLSICKNALSLSQWQLIKNTSSTPEFISSHLPTINGCRCLQSHNHTILYITGSVSLKKMGMTSSGMS